MNSWYRKAILIFLIMAYIGGCEKLVDNEDYRAAFVGKYQVTKEISCYGPCGSCYSMKDTIISVRYGDSDSTIFILGRELKIDTAGVYDGYHYGLRLWNDSIRSYFMSGGLGCGQYIKYEGFKISNNP